MGIDASSGSGLGLFRNWIRQAQQVHRAVGANARIPSVGCDADDVVAQEPLAVREVEGGEFLPRQHINHPQPTVRIAEQPDSAVAAATAASDLAGAVGQLL